jgi:AAA ATPase-like protein/transcriptional activator
MGDQVRLHLTHLDLDTERFDRFAAEENWAAAADLVSGRFLEGFIMPGCSAVEDWLRVERERWSTRGIRALLETAAQRLAAGDLEQATARARQALAVDPLSEPAVRAVMRCLALAGLRTDALQVYDTFVRHAEKTLGIRPDQETAALAGRVREGRAQPAAVSLSQDAPSRRTPLIGRARELGRLERAWTACRAGGRATVALVLGDPGTGKSRLAEEVLERARLDGAAVATARAVEADRGDAWSGLLAIADAGLRDAPGVTAAPPEALGAIAARLPTWAERFSGAPRDGDLSVGRAFRAIVRAACEERPVALLLDDAQWFDRETLQTVVALARDAASLPCYILLTAPQRTGRIEIESLRARFGREVRGAAVSLGPLRREDLKVLARWALPDYDATQVDRVTRRVAVDSAGLPLLAAEMLHAVALLGNNAWPTPTRTMEETLPGGIPDALVSAVSASYSVVSQPAQRVLDSLAVLDARLSRSALQRATGLPQDALGLALDELEWQRWLVADSRGYTFVARLVGTILATRTGATRRQEILERARG